MSTEDERWGEIIGKARIPDADPAFKRKLESELMPAATGGGATAPSRPALPRRRMLAVLGIAAAGVLAAAAVYLASPWILPPAEPENRAPRDSRPSPSTAAPGTQPAGCTTPAGPGERKGPADPVEVGPAKPEKASPQPGGRQTVPPGTEITVRADPEGERMVMDRAAEMSLFQLAWEADTVLGGRFAEGGHDNTFVLDRVLKGEEVERVVHLLTETGLICPGSAWPRGGKWAVAFCRRGSKGLKVPSASYLRQFGDETAYAAVADRVSIYVGPDAVPAILGELQDAIRGGLPGKGGDLEELESAQKDLEALRKISSIIEQFKEQGPEKVREEIGKIVAGLPAEQRERIRARARPEGDGGRAPVPGLGDAVEALKLLGGMQAGAGLLEAALSISATRESGIILKALAEIRLQGGGRATRRVSREDLEEMENALRDDLGKKDPDAAPDQGKGPRRPSDEERRKLQEMIDRGRRLADEGGAEGEPGRAGRAVMSPETCRAVAGVLSRVNDALERPCSSVPPGDEDQLRKAFVTLLAALFRRAALDAGAHMDSRIAALDGIREIAPDALSPEQAVSLAADAALSYPVRTRAVQLCGARRLPGAVPVLVRLLREEPDQEGYEGPPPARPYAYSPTSWFALKVDAIEALGAIADAAAGEALVSLLETPAGPPAPSLRRYMQEALDRLRKARQGR